MQDVLEQVLRTLPLLLSGVLVGCAAQRASVKPPALFAGVNGPLIIAHRGGSLEAPENTVSSISHGVAVGSDWQELDVTVSSDDAVVVIHDDTVDRTTTGHGRAEEMTLAQLKALDAGRPHWSDHGKETLALFSVTPPDFATRFPNERVPTLDEILAIPNTRLMIEMKKTERAAVLAEKVVAAIRRAQAWDRVALGSFETELLERVHTLEPSIPLIGICEEEHEIDDKLDVLPLSVLAVRMDLIGDALAKAPAGVAVWGWTAYSVAMADAAIGQGAHGVITDVPDAVVKAWRTPPPLVMQPGE